MLYKGFRVVATSRLLLSTKPVINTKRFGIKGFTKSRLL